MMSAVYDFTILQAFDCMPTHIDIVYFLAEWAQLDIRQRYKKYCWQPSCNIVLKEDALWLIKNTVRFTYRFASKTCTINAFFSIKTVSLQT